MENPKPVKPKTLPPLAEAILQELAKHPESREIVLGGGIALKHYLDFRGTNDIDAWWRTERDIGALAIYKKALRDVAGRTMLNYRDRTMNVTDSLELLDGTKKTFSFQISSREVGLDSPSSSEWPPIQIETFRDNLGSKMNALVNRGAPRDFLDIFQVNEREMTNVDECWEIWSAKNQTMDQDLARAAVAGNLEVIEQRRSLQAMQIAERDQAHRLRSWFREVFIPRQTA